MTELQYLEIAAQYCDQNSWGGSQFPRTKTIEDYYIVMSVGTVGDKSDLTTILTLTASRELYGKHWACQTPIPLCFSSVQDFSEHMDSAISNIRKLYNKCQLVYQESSHTAK